MTKASDVESSALVNDLNKLRKDEIIDLLLRQKLRFNVNGKVLMEYVEKVSLKILSHVKASGSNLQTEHSSYNSYTHDVDIQSLRKLNFHLGKRILDQENIILLLKNDSNIINNFKAKSGSAPSSVERKAFDFLNHAELQIHFETSIGSEPNRAKNLNKQSSAIHNSEASAHQPQQPKTITHVRKQPLASSVS